MQEYRFLVPLLIFLSPLLYILSGCQWKPDSSGNVIHVKTSDFLAPKVKPVVAPVAVKSPECRCENCDCVDCKCKFTPVTYDPLRVPSADDPYAPPPKVTLPKSNPPLVNQELLSDCPSGRCGSLGYGPRYIARPEGTYEIDDGDETYSRLGGQRRGLFGRWRR